MSSMASGLGTTRSSLPGFVIAGLTACAFLAVAAQLVRLAVLAPAGVRIQAAEPLVVSFTRPDIVDRKGRLLATDLQAFSLYADPTLVIDVDDAAEKLTAVFPEMPAAELRGQLADRTRRFIWLRRGLSPGLAQRVHDLGIPGVSFRPEPRRTYPQGRLAGHVLGGVSIDNRGLAGLERHIDDALGLESGLSGELQRPPVVLTLDIGVQHGLEEELALALAHYRASGVAGVILDVGSGEILAAASLPDVDPARPGEALDADRIDRLQVATYELGSVLKAFTVAMALNAGLVRPDTVLDVRAPLQAGRYLIRDLHPSGRPLTVREIFIQSSNVGAGLIAQAAGVEKMRAFLTRAGLAEPMRSEVGAISAPRLPQRWGEAELITVAYGHGLAVAPLQFAAAAAALVNGGLRVRPTYVRSMPGVVAPVSAPARVVSAETSAAMRDLMRRAVTQPNGTGRRADVAGFEVGGKTGTAEMADPAGYRAKSVVASFLAAFPISAPRHLLLVTLIEPKPGADTNGQITAGVNAAPVAGRIIARTGHLLSMIAR